MSQKTLDVRGYTSFNYLASSALKVLAILTDFFIVLLFGTVSCERLNIQPIPNVSGLIVFTLISTFYWIPQKYLLKITLGQRIWGLKNVEGKLFQCDHLSPLRMFTSCFATTLMVLLSCTSLHGYIFGNPIWQIASPWKLQPYLPNSGKWTVAPYFYALGGWPKEFLGKSIFYTLPYEKGPPTRFVGHIVANWDSEIRLIMEGPKTPESLVSQSELKNCFTKKLPLACLSMRESTLSRHLNEIQSLSPSAYSLKWFTVENPTVPSAEQTQGIYLSATTSRYLIDRFILVTDKGIHQTLSLKRPKSSIGQAAFELLQNTVRSLRTFSDLDPGRAWINREIQEINLGELNSIKDPLALRSKLAEIQSLLISRISVEPSSFESYFHLAGTSLLLVKSARTLSTTAEMPSACAIKNLDSAYQFAKDISPSDSRTHQIETLWLESKKL